VAGKADKWLEKINKYSKKIQSAPAAARECPGRTSSVVSPFDEQIPFVGEERQL
jgi:hypothetical protein